MDKNNKADEKIRNNNDNNMLKLSNKTKGNRNIIADTRKNTEVIDETRNLITKLPRFNEQSNFETSRQQRKKAIKRKSAEMVSKNLDDINENLYKNQSEVLTDTTEMPVNQGFNSIDGKTSYNSEVNAFDEKKVLTSFYSDPSKADGNVTSFESPVSKSVSDSKDTKVTADKIILKNDDKIKTSNLNKKVVTSHHKNENIKTSSGNEILKGVKSNNEKLYTSVKSHNTHLLDNALTNNVNKSKRINKMQRHKNTKDFQKRSLKSNNTKNLPPLVKDGENIPSTINNINNNENKNKNSLAKDDFSEKVTDESEDWRYLGTRQENSEGNIEPVNSGFSHEILTNEEVLNSKFNLYNNLDVIANNDKNTDFNHKIISDNEKSKLESSENVMATLEISKKEMAKPFNKVIFKESNKNLFKENYENVGYNTKSIQDVAFLNINDKSGFENPKNIDSSTSVDNFKSAGSHKNAENPKVMNENNKDFSKIKSDLHKKNDNAKVIEIDVKNIALTKVKTDIADNFAYNFKGISTNGNNNTSADEEIASSTIASTRSTILSSKRILEVKKKFDKVKNQKLDSKINSNKNTDKVTSNKEFNSEFKKNGKDLFKESKVNNAGKNQDSLRKEFQKKFQKKKTQKLHAKEIFKNANSKINVSSLKSGLTGAKAVAQKVGTGVSKVLLSPQVLIIIAISSFILILGMGVTPMFMGTTATVSSSFPSHEIDMLAAENYYRNLENTLRTETNNIEADNPSYTSYDKTIGEIGHNPYELISYLSAKYATFTLGSVQAELDRIFTLQYQLNYTDVSPNTLKVVLTQTSLSGIFQSELTTEEYNVYLTYISTSGNLPELFDDVLSSQNSNGAYTDYEIPPHYLVDTEFRALITEAERYLGYPYVWGGSSPSTSFDCSGFVSWVLRGSGVFDVPRSSAESLFNATVPIAPSEAQPGDLVFFTGTYATSSSVTHVGIYVGDNMMIHCGDPISYADLGTSYWQNHFYSYGRIPDNI